MWRLVARNLPKPAGVSSPRLTSKLFRPYSASPSMDEYERKIFDILSSELSPKNLLVKDVSGGCGSMFAIEVESSRFKGIPMIKQHRIVNEVLKEEIAKWHGLQLKTKGV